MDVSNLHAKSIKLRLIDEDDASFVLALRLDPKYNTFLSQVSPDVNIQKEWIKNYKIDETNGLQYYFIIERISDSTPCGTVRVYDFREDSFCWGSWILNEDKTLTAAVESALLIYKFGFDILGYSNSHFEVVKGNNAVVSFHEKFGAKKVDEDDIHYFFSLEKESVSSLRRKYKI